MPKSIEERFHEKYEINPENGCWEWTACLNGWGYGRIAREGKAVSAHRVSYELHKGPIPDGLCVCHRCDNPKCVNPEHLFLGTSLDNVRDMDTKGRCVRAHGESHGFSKLTKEEVFAIRAMQMRHPGRYGLGAFLGRWFGVTHKAICEIKNGRSWRHI